jgi:hypothetical protein
MDMNRGTLLALAIVLPRLAAAQPVPLQVTAVQVTPAGHVEYVLTNTSTKTAIAWSVNMTVRGNGGAPARNTRITTDNYIVEAQRGVVPDDEIDSSWLLPGTPRRFEVPGRFTTEPEITPAAVVFIDDTARGDAFAVSEIFRMRAEARETWDLILKQLRAVQNTYKGLPALREAAARMATPVATREPSLERSVQGQLNALATRAEHGGVDADAALASVIQQVERSHRATLRHSTQRKEL